MKMVLFSFSLILLSFSILSLSRSISTLVRVQGVGNAGVLGVSDTIQPKTPQTTTLINSGSGTTEEMQYYAELLNIYKAQPQDSSLTHQKENIQALQEIAKSLLKFLDHSNQQN